MNKKICHLEGQLILGIDLGTSSLRTALFDSKANRISGAFFQQAYRLKLSKDGTAELDPKILKQSAELCLEKTLRVYRKMSFLRTKLIVGVGVSAFCHSLMGVDQHGKTLTPIYTWADSRCQKDANLLRKRFNEKLYHRQTGCMLRSSFWPAKLIWLKKNDPNLFQRVTVWMSPGEWLQREWSGFARCSYSMASTTGLLDLHRLDWHSLWLERFGISRKKLNPLGDEPWIGSRVLSTELKDSLWFPAIGDGAASNLGSGATDSSKAAINFGTSAAIRVILKKKYYQPIWGLFCYRVDEERYLLGGAISNAGNLRQWGLDIFQKSKKAFALERIIKLQREPQHGLVVLPFWSTERAPTWPEGLKGTIHGLTYATSSLDLYQAILEASYLRLASILSLMNLHSKVRLFISGGIQNSTASIEKIVHSLGRPVDVINELEASLRGAAVFVVQKLGGKIKKITIKKSFYPNKNLVEVYRKARQRQEELEQLLTRTI